MVFIVVLYVSWCRRLESMPSIRPQVHAHNLKCSSVCPRASFSAASFTVQYVRSVGHDVSPGKCVVLSTSKAVRKSMKLWDVSGDGLVVILTLLGGLELGHFPRGLRMLLMVFRRLVRCLWGSRLSWVWSEGNICSSCCHCELGLVQ